MAELASEDEHAFISKGKLGGEWAREGSAEATLMCIALWCLNSSARLVRRKASMSCKWESL